MYRVNGELLLRIGETLQWLGTRKPWGSSEQQLTAQLRQELQAHLRGLGESCRSMGLTMTAVKADSLDESLNQQWLTWKLFDQQRVEVRNRMHDELKRTPLFFVPPERADLVAAPAVFGQRVLDRFPSAAYDVDEAAICMAFGLFTASVFHLMRVTELGLMALAKALGVSSKVKGAQANWGAVLHLTADEIQAKNKAGATDWTAEKRAFFESLHAHLSTVKNAWRNPTMHLEHRYDDEEAEDVLTAVRAFIRQTARHLDEDGNYHP